MVVINSLREESDVYNVKETHLSKSTGRNQIRIGFENFSKVPQNKLRIGTNMRETSIKKKPHPATN